MVLNSGKKEGKKEGEREGERKGRREKGWEEGRKGERIKEAQISSDIPQNPCGDAWQTW